MATCLTKYHGALDYSEEAVVHFSRGLFGFESETRFLLLELAAMHPLVYLQSLATPQLCFLALPVMVVCREYRLMLSPEDLAEVDLPGDRQPRIGTDVLCLALLTVQENRPATANLMAPVTLNLRNRKAVQGICTASAYSHQHTFLEAEEVAACS